MKINAITPEQAISKYSSAQLRTKQVQPAAMQPDRVELSDSALSFSQIIKAAKQVMQKEDSAETARIAAVAGQVRAGTYDVSSSAIAARMIRNIVNVDT